MSNPKDSTEVLNDFQTVWNESQHKIFDVSFTALNLEFVQYKRLSDLLCDTTIDAI